MVYFLYVCARSSTACFSTYITSTTTMRGTFLVYVSTTLLCLLVLVKGEIGGTEPYEGVQIVSKTGQLHTANVGQTFGYLFPFNLSTQTTLSQSFVLPTRTKPVYFCTKQQTCTRLNSTSQLLQALSLNSSLLEFNLGTLDRVYTSTNPNLFDDPSKCSLSFDTKRGVNFNQTALYAFGTQVLGNSHFGGVEVGNKFSNCNSHRLGLTPFTTTDPTNGQLLYGIYIKVYSQGAKNVYLTGSFNSRRGNYTTAGGASASATTWLHPRDLVSELTTENKLIKLQRAPIVPSLYQRMRSTGFAKRFNASTGRLSDESAELVEAMMYEENIYHAIVVTNESSVFTNALYQVVSQRANFVDESSRQEYDTLIGMSQMIDLETTSTQNAINADLAEMQLALQKIRAVTSTDLVLAPSTLQALFALESSQSVTGTNGSLVELSSVQNGQLLLHTFNSTKKIIQADISFVQGFANKAINMTYTLTGLQNIMVSLMALIPANSFTNAQALSVAVANVAENLQNLEDDVFFTLPNANATNLSGVLQSTAVAIIEALTISVGSYEYQIVDASLNAAIGFVKTNLAPSSGFVNAVQTVYLNNLLDVAIDLATQISQDAANVAITNEPFNQASIVSEMIVLANVLQRTMTQITTLATEVTAVLTEIASILPRGTVATDISSQVVSSSSYISSGSSSSSSSSSSSADQENSRIAARHALVSALLSITRLNQMINVTVNDAPIEVLSDLLDQVISSTPTSRTSLEIAQLVNAANEWLLYMLNTTAPVCKGPVINFAPSLLTTNPNLLYTYSHNLSRIANNLIQVQSLAGPQLPSFAPIPTSVRNVIASTINQISTFAAWVQGAWNSSFSNNYITVEEMGTSTHLKNLEIAWTNAAKSYEMDQNNLGYLQSQTAYINTILNSYKSKPRDYTQGTDVFATSFTTIPYPYLADASIQIQDLPLQIAGTVPTLAALAVEQSFAWTSSENNTLSSPHIAKSVLQSKDNQVVLRIDVATFTSNGTFEAAAEKIAQLFQQAQSSKINGSSPGTGSVYAFNTIQLRGVYDYHLVASTNTVAEWIESQTTPPLGTVSPPPSPGVQYTSNSLSLTNNSVAWRKTVLPFGLNPRLSKSAIHTIQTVGNSNLLNTVDASMIASQTAKSLKSFVNTCHGLGIAVLLETDEQSFLNFTFNVLYSVDTVVHLFDQSLFEARNELEIGTPLLEFNNHAIAGLASYLESSPYGSENVADNQLKKLSKAGPGNRYYDLNNVATVEYLASLHDRFILNFHIDGIVHELAPESTNSLQDYDPHCVSTHLGGNYIQAIEFRGDKSSYSGNSFVPSNVLDLNSYSSSEPYEISATSNEAEFATSSSNVGSSDTANVMDAYSSRFNCPLVTVALSHYSPAMYLFHSLLAPQVTYILAGDLPEYVLTLEAFIYPSTASSFQYYTDTGAKYFTCNITAADVAQVGVDQCIFQRYTTLTGPFNNITTVNNNEYFVRTEWLKATNPNSYDWLLPPMLSELTYLPADGSVVSGASGMQNPYSSLNQANQLPVQLTVAPYSIITVHGASNDGGGAPPTYPLIVTSGTAWLAVWIRLRLLSGNAPVMMQGFESLYAPVLAQSIDIPVDPLSASVLLRSTHPSFMSSSATVHQVVTAGWDAARPVNASIVYNNLTNMLSPLPSGSQFSWIVAARVQLFNNYLIDSKGNGGSGLQIISSSLSSVCNPTPIDANTGLVPDLDGDGFSDEFSPGCVSPNTEYLNIPPAPLDTFNVHTFVNHHLSLSIIVTIPMPMNVALQVLVGTAKQCQTAFADGTSLDAPLNTTSTSQSLTCTLPPTSVLTFKFVFDTRLPTVPSSYPTSGTVSQPQGSLYTLAILPSDLGFGGVDEYFMACNKSVDLALIETCQTQGTNNYIQVQFPYTVVVIAAGQREASPLAATVDREFVPWSIEDGENKNKNSMGVGDSNKKSNSIHTSSSSSSSSSLPIKVKSPTAANNNGPSPNPATVLCPIYAKNSALANQASCTEARLGATFFDIGVGSDPQARGIMFQVWAPISAGVSSVEVEIFALVPNQHPSSDMDCSAWIVATPIRSIFSMTRNGNFFLVLLNIAYDILDTIPYTNDIRLEYRYVFTMTSGQVLYRVDPYSPGGTNSFTAALTAYQNKNVLFETTIIGRPWIGADTTLLELKLAMRQYTDTVALQSWRADPLVLYQTVPQLTVNKHVAANWPPTPVNIPINDTVPNIVPNTEALVETFFARRPPPTQAYQTLRRGHLQRLGVNAVILSGMFSDRSSFVNATWLPSSVSVDLNPLSHDLMATTALFTVFNNFNTNLQGTCRQALSEGDEVCSLPAIGGGGAIANPFGFTGQPLSKPIQCWPSQLPNSVNLPLVPSIGFGPSANSSSSIELAQSNNLVSPSGTDVNLDKSSQGVVSPGDWNYGLYVEKRLGFEGYNRLSLLEYIRECQLRHIRVAVEVAFDQFVSGGPLFRFFQTRDVDSLNGTLPDWGYASPSELLQPGSSPSSGVNGGYAFIGSTYLTGPLTLANNESLWYSTGDGERPNTDNPIVQQYIRDQVQMLIEQYYIDAIMLDTTNFIYTDNGSGNQITSAILVMRQLHLMVRNYPGVQMLSSSLEETAFITANDLAPGASLDTQFYSDAYDAPETPRIWDLTAPATGFTIVPGQGSGTSVPIVTSTSVTLNGTLPLAQRIVYTEEALVTLDGKNRQASHSDCPFCMFVLPFTAVGWPLIYQGQEFADSTSGSVLPIVSESALLANYAKNSTNGIIAAVKVTNFTINNMGSPPFNTSNNNNPQVSFEKKAMEFIGLYKNTSMGLSGAYINVFQNSSDRYSVRRWHGVDLTTASTYNQSANGGQPLLTAPQRPTYTLTYFGNSTAPGVAPVVSFMVIDRAANGAAAFTTPFEIEQVFIYGPTPVNCPQTIQVYYQSIVNCQLYPGTVIIFSPVVPLVIGFQANDFNPQPYHVANAAVGIALITGNTGKKQQGHITNP